jgi:hypothetical protein
MLGGSTPTLPEHVRGVWTGSLHAKKIKFQPPPVWETAIIVMVFFALTAFAFARAYSTDDCSNFCAKIPEQAYEEQSPEAAEKCASGVSVEVVVHPRACGGTSFKFLRTKIVSIPTSTTTTIDGFTAPTPGDVEILAAQAVQSPEFSSTMPSPMDTASLHLLMATTIPILTTVTLPDDIPWTPFPSTTSGVIHSTSTPCPTTTSGNTASTFHCLCPFHPPTPATRLRRSLTYNNFQGLGPGSVPEDRSAGVPIGHSATATVVAAVIASVLGCTSIVVCWLFWKKWSAKKEAKRREAGESAVGVENHC